MSLLLKSFDQYWQESANTNQKLVAPKYKRKAVVLNYSTERKEQEVIPESLELIEERACILASDVGLPLKWAEAVVKLRNIKRPSNIPIDSWFNIQRACNILYADDFRLLKEIVAYDWSIYDIYGCGINNPCNSFDQMGLLLLLKPTERIIEVQKECIRVSSNSGGTSSFYPKLDRGLKIALLYDSV